MTWALGASIGLELEKQGLQQSDLAELVDIPEPTLSQMINGKRAIDMEQLAKAASGLGIPSWALMKQAEELLAANQGKRRRKRPARSVRLSAGDLPPTDRN